MAIVIPVDVHLNLNDKDIDELRKKISDIQASGGNSADAFKPLVKSAGKASTDLKKLQLGVSSLNTSFAKLKSTLLSLISIGALVRLGKEALGLSADLVEVQNVVDTTFGNMADTVNKFAKDEAKAFGLSELQAKQYASTLGTIMKASGVGADATLKMSVNLTKLAGDIASFNNLPIDQAFEKLRSGITGETEPLKSLGVVMTEANLKAYLLSNGITESYSSMSEAEKVAVRYNYIMNALADSQGDFSKTVGSWSNQVRLLTTNLQQLGSIMGGLLQNILYPFLTVANQLVSLAITGATALAKFFGFDLTSVQANQGVLDGASSAMDGYTDSTDDANAALDKLTKTQKKSLASFHKLNVLQSKNSSTGSTSGSTGSGVSKIDIPLIDYKPVDTNLQSVSDEIVGFLTNIKNNIQPFTDAIKNLWDNGLSQLANFTWDALKGFYDNFLVPIGQWAFGENTGLTRLVNIINNSLMQIDWDRLSAALNRFWTAIEPYAVNFAEGLIDFLEDIAGIGVELVNWLPDWLNVFSGALENGDPEAARSLGYALGVIVTGLTAISALSSAVKLLSDLVSIVNTPVGGIGLAFSGLTLAVSQFVEMFQNGWSIIKEILMLLGIALVAVGAIILGAPALVVAVVAGIVALVANLVIVIKEYGYLIKELFFEVVDAVAGFFKNLWQGIVDGITWLALKIASIVLGIVEKVQSIVGAIKDWFANLWQNITDTFTIFTLKVASIILGIRDKIVDVFNSIVDALSAVIDTVKGVLKGIANFFIGLLNGAIGAINSLSITAPDWIPGVGGKTFGFNIPQIPELAKGAVIPPNNEFMAILGDQRSGVNIETPLATMLQAFREALDDWDGSGSDGDIIIPIYVNNELSTEEIIRKQDIERYRRNGK